MSHVVTATTLKPVLQWQPEVLLVGNSMVADHLAKMVKDVGSRLKIELDPLAKDDVKQLIFGRDHRVMLLDGSYLVPCNISLPPVLLEYKLKAILPEASLHFLKSPRSCYSDGFLPKFTSQAMQFAKENNIVCKQGRSVIEGGNCHLFSTLEARPRAIIGVHSLLLTLIALEEQHYFDDPIVQEKMQELQIKSKAPSMESLRMARNLDLYKKREPLDLQLSEVNNWIRNWGMMPTLERESLKEQYLQKLKELKQIESRLSLIYPNTGAFFDCLSAPLSETERQDKKLQDEGSEIEAKLAIAKELIADELHVELEDVIYIPQVRFHIDMDLFVDPFSQTVFLHDESLALKYLRNSRFRGKEIYERASEEIFQKHKTATCALATELEERGCRVVKVAGVFEGQGKNRVNFMNGCFIPTQNGMVYAAGGAKQVPHFEDFFMSQMLNLLSDVQVRFIDGATMEEILTFSGGGLHCLTWPKGIANEVKNTEL